MAVKLFNSNKYSVTFLVIHLLIRWPPAVEVVETLSWFLCKH